MPRITLVKSVSTKRLIVVTSGALSFAGGEADEVGSLRLHPGNELTVRVTTCCSQARGFWVIALWIIII